MTITYSVVIPAHNAADFVGAAVTSVLLQTVPPSEIMVVDDGSSDLTAHSARSAGATVVSTHRPSGPSAARNRGVAETTAPFVCFLDADDEWKPDHVERLLGGMVATGAVFGSSGAELFGAETGEISARLVGGIPLDIRNELLVENPVIQSGAAITRAAFVAAGGYDESMRMSEDYDLWHRLAALGPFSFEPVPTVRRRMHESQLTHRNDAVLYEAGWTVRRKYVVQRWRDASASEHEAIFTALVTAADRDVGHAIYRGDIAALSSIRRELATTDSMLSLSGRLSVIGGEGRPMRSMMQSLRGVGRSVLNQARRTW